MSVHAMATDAEARPGPAVLVVGGGPSGLGTASMLAQRGYKNITLLEKRDVADFYEPNKSFSYSIDSRGQHTLEAIGALDRVVEQSVPSTEFRLRYFFADKTTKEVNSNLRAQKNVKTNYWLPRRRFNRALFDHVTGDAARHPEGAIDVRLGWSCSRLAPTGPGGALEAVLEGPDGEQERVVPAMVVACDGLGSGVRDSMAETYPGEFEVKQLPSPSSGLRFKVLSVPSNFALRNFGVEETSPEEAIVLPGTGKGRNAVRLGFLPQKDREGPRTCNIVAKPDCNVFNCKTGEEAFAFFEQHVPQFPARDVVDPDVMDAFARSDGGRFPTPQYCETIGKVHRVGSGADASRPAQAVFLLGDAAHAFPPDIGQGVNAALDDVGALAAALDTAKDDLARAAEIYQERHAPNAKALVHIAQIGAPYQYRQSKAGYNLWLMRVVLRMLLHKVLPFLVSAPAMYILQGPRKSYREIWEEAERGTRAMKAMGVALAVAALAVAWRVLRPAAGLAPA
ncbi:unnamed protein product [Pedinophyceae sp. YPF-701]|nr:unnamed protein product [Pedinophyceae sp. YPF-701]